MNEQLKARGQRSAIYLWLESLAPLQGFVVVLTAGLSLLALSFAVDVAEVQRADLVPGQSAKDVGFSSAPNWSFAYCSFLPFAIFGLLASLRAIPSALRAMAHHGMFVDQEWNDVTQDQIDKAWDDALASASKYLVLLLVFACLHSWAEWVAQSAWPLLNGTISEKFKEPDWAVAHINSSVPWRAANAVFSFAAFALQAVAAAALATYVVLVIALIQFSESVTTGDSLRLIPDPDSTDPRRGFERLEPALIHIFNVALLAFGMLYASRYWNAYLQDGAASLWLFARADFTLGYAANGFHAWLQGVTVNFSGGSAVFVGVVGVILAATVFALPAIFLQNGALRARAALLSRVRETGKYRQHSRETIEARMKTMVLWPTKYVSSPVLATIVLFAGACLAIYQLMPLYAGVVLSAVVALVMKKAVPGSRD